MCLFRINANTGLSCTAGVRRENWEGKIHGKADFDVVARPDEFRLAVVQSCLDRARGISSCFVHRKDRANDPAHPGRLQKQTQGNRKCWSAGSPPSYSP